MNYFNRKIIILAVIVGVTLCGVAYLFIARATTTQTLVINYSDANDIAIYRNEGDHSSQDPVATIKKTGDSATLEQGSSYIVTYKGDAGYTDGKIFIDIKEDTKKITIKPFFSSSTLVALLQKEQEEIQAALLQKYPTIEDLYSVQRGRLYQNGEWYGTTLQYKGDDSYNADTLRVVMKKENSKWVVKTTPPAISLSKYIHKDIPTKILDDVNNNQDTPLLDKYKDEETNVYVPQ